MTLSDLAGEAWPPPAAPEPPAPDPSFGHFLRFLGVYLGIWITSQFLFGLAFTLSILDRTGHRKRDVFTFVLPFRGMWRYTARSVYWQPRPDRRSGVLEPPLRPFVIFGGYALFAAVAGLIIFAVIFVEDGWTSFDRRSFIAELQEGGNYDAATAECITDELIAAFPGGVPDADDPEFSAVVPDVVEFCDN